MLEINTDLDCHIDNYGKSLKLYCGSNYIEKPSVSQLIFRSIEHHDLTINKVLTSGIDKLTLSFSPLIRNKNQKINGPVIIKTNDPWDFFGLYDIQQRKEILPPEYGKIGNGIRFVCDDEFLQIQNRESGNYGIVTKYGEEIFPCQFLNIYKITKEGLAIVETKKGKTFINAKDEVIFPVKSEFYCGYSFENGLLRICHNNKIGYINQYGQMIINPIFDSDKHDWHIGFANGYCWERRNGKWGIIDVNGTVTCDFIFDYHGSKFDVNKVSTIVVNNKLYFVSPNGEMEYRDAEQGYYGGESVYIVKKNTGWGFQNFKGDSLYFDAVFDKIIAFDEGMCIVKYQGRDGIVTKEGKYIDLSNLNINSISRFNSGRARIVRKINDIKYVNVGYIDYNGNIVIDTIYHGYSSSEFQNGIAKVERYDPYNNQRKILSAYIDIHGNYLCDFEVKELSGNPLERFFHKK